MTDRYLKSVLTVIAAALVWIAVQLTIGSVTAAAPKVEPGIKQVSITWPESVNGYGRNNEDVPRKNQAYVPVWCVNCR